MKMNYAALIVISIMLCGYILPNEKENKIQYCGNKLFFEDSMSLGRKLFLQNCASCHNIRKDATGPALVNITKKRTKKYLQQFIKDWTKLIEEKNCFAIEAIKYSPTQMMRFNFKEFEIDSILQFLEDASTLNKLTFKESSIKVLMDSCEKYTDALRKLNKPEKRNYMEVDKLKEVIRKWKPKFKQCFCEPKKYKLEEEERFALLKDVIFTFTAESQKKDWSIIATNDSLVLIGKNYNRTFKEMTIWKSNKKDAYLINSDDTYSLSNKIELTLIRSRNKKDTYKITFNLDHQTIEIGFGELKRQ